jgi:hypothetical protein
MTAVSVPLREAQPENEHLGRTKCNDLPQSTAGRPSVHSICALSAPLNFAIRGNVLAALGADHQLFILQRLRVVQSMASTIEASEFIHYRALFLRVPPHGEASDMRTRRTIEPILHVHILIALNLAMALVRHRGGMRPAPSSFAGYFREIATSC